MHAFTHSGINVKHGLSYHQLKIQPCLMKLLLQDHFATLLSAGFSSEQCWLESSRLFCSAVAAADQDSLLHQVSTVGCP